MRRDITRQMLCAEVRVSFNTHLVQLSFFILSCAVYSSASENYCTYPCHKSYTVFNLYPYLYKYTACICLVLMLDTANKVL